MNPILIGTSWKMNKTLAQALSFSETLCQQMSGITSKIQPFIIPPFTCVRDVTTYLNRNHIHCLTGVQNMHFADSGAYTGEISPLMVKDCGAIMVELGHSERREYFGETDACIALKVQAALRHQLRPLICIGDSQQEKQWGCSKEVVIRQLKAALSLAPAEQAKNIIIAYEPIWAIGENGTPATPQQAQEVHYALRQTLNTLFGNTVSQSIPLLYGGSVNPENCLSLLSEINIDGLFIGRSAWHADGFCHILRLINDSLTVSPT
ncbi:triose-phosphate isomerase [Brenneria corticis]|uniref:Triosephosphate isomerase n=1 Tax=Brenneria corticis TaxID=2173106 RepID=A0A2U1U7N2_9GAMM|nr:triose-phosphate isomerase [Brenneria sp. CFCC 11842]PWC17652.1 triose-phosphate isomerase [Brenneria sp. CFCC 11842]